MPSRAIRQRTGLQVMPRYHGTKRPKTTYRNRFAHRFCPACGSYARGGRIGQWDWLGGFLLALARKRYHRREGGNNCMSSAEDYAMKLAKLPDRIAAIVGKTYAVMGDAAEMADDQALMMIRDRLEELDISVIEKNKNKRLNRR